MMENQILDRVLFHPMGSMGDALVYTGIVRYYSEISNQVYLPVYPYILKTLTTLHKDIPNIFVLDDAKKEHLVKDPRCYKLVAPHLVQCTPEQHTLWDEQTYTMYDLPFSLRYRKFVLPKNLSASKELYDRIITNPDFILVHNGVLPRNDRIPIDLTSWRTPENPLEKYQVITIDETLSEDMMDYIDLIRNAKEIHCVASSMFVLVDSITQQTKAKLYFHHKRKSTFMRINNRYNDYRWTPVYYKELL